MLKTECQMCGCTFEAKSNRARFCMECRKQRKKEFERIRTFGRAFSLDAKKKEKNFLGIAEISVKAKNLGISYGQYVARFGG